MNSETAKIAIEEMWAAGLKPTVEDIVRLNALGLRVDHGVGGEGDFAALPRVAFLGTYIMREPTIAVRMWLDEVERMFTDDLFSRLILTAYAFMTPAQSLPDINEPKKIRADIEAFRDGVALLFTESELLAAIEYVLQGCGPNDQEEPEQSKKQKEEAAKVREVPQPLRSYARFMLGRAAVAGIAKDVAESSTVRQLEDLLARAMCARGADAVSDDKMQLIGEFNRTADVIRERLEMERKALNGEE